jgi:hypothetical protein
LPPIFPFEPLLSLEPNLAPARAAVLRLRVSNRDVPAEVRVMPAGADDATRASHARPRPAILRDAAPQRTQRATARVNLIPPLTYPEQGREAGSTPAASTPALAGHRYQCSKRRPIGRRSFVRTAPNSGRQGRTRARSRRTSRISAGTTDDAAASGALVTSVISVLPRPTATMSAITRTVVPAVVTSTSARYARL